MFRSRIFNVNQTASTVDLRVHDITNLSEIFIDNLVINAGQELAVPEPSSIAIVLVAVSGLWGARAVLRFRAPAAAQAGSQRSRNLGWRASRKASLKRLKPN